MTGTDLGARVSKLKFPSLRDSPRYYLNKYFLMERMVQQSYKEEFVGLVSI